VNKKDLLNISIISFILLTIVTLTFYFIGRNEIYSHKIEKKLIPPWGYPLKNKTEISSTLEGRTFNYKLTSNSLRELSNTKAFPHFILSGGSNTFGQNLSIDKTLSSLLRKTERYSKYHHTILASPGWGPNNILAYMSSKNFEDLGLSHDGIFIYNFTRPHFHRACGLDQTLFWTKGILPKFEVENENLVHKGMYRDKLSFHAFLIRAGIYKSILKLGIKSSRVLDRKISSRCITHTAKIIKEMKRRYLEIGNNGKFYVSLFPTMKEYNKQGVKELFKALNEVEIKTLTFQSYKKELNPSHFFSDGHVNEQSNKVHTKLLIDSL
jgi:hypothetical protein